MKKFQKTNSHLKFGECTARIFKTAYRNLLKKKKLSSKILLQKRAISLILGTLDCKVKTFLHMLRRKGGVVNTVFAAAIAKALIERSPDEHLKCLDLDSSIWAKSLIRRMNFTKPACTTSKSQIPELAKKEAKLINQHQIADHVKHHLIPPSLVALTKVCSSTCPLLAKHYHARDQNMWQSRAYHSKCPSQLHLESR